MRRAVASSIAAMVAVGGLIAVSQSGASVDPTASDGTTSFTNDSVSLRNARAGQEYNASVGGLTTESGPRLTKESGPQWAKVAPGGRITGTPPAGATGIKTVVVESGSDRIKARINVRADGTRLVPRLRAMSFNLWHGGSQVEGSLAKQVRFLVDQDVDVVGFQESDDTPKKIAAKLGWEHYAANDDVQMISKYPIVGHGKPTSETGLAGGFIEVRVDDETEQNVVLWNAHLGYDPYGPYDTCFGQMSEKELMARERKSGRTEQITALIKAMRGHLGNSDHTPVLLVGDFNAPSHLDYTDATADRHCGYADVPWPTSIKPSDAGLKDSYRVAHPDPAAEPGITWSPIYKTFTGGYGYDDHAGEPEPQDRIDFVRFKGALDVRNSRAVVAGDPSPYPDHGSNEWTSDHAAVLTAFTVN